MDKFRFGILGVGRISTESFAPALILAKNAELYAVGSRDINRAASLSPVKAYGSYEEVIRDPMVDVVYIATHNGLHKELAIKALLAGKHVISEKPLSCL